MPLQRDLISGEPPVQPEGRSRVDIKVQTEAGRAFVRVAEYGGDLEEIIRFRLKELCQRKVECIFLDLPLGHPAVIHYCAAMEMLGFFFGCVIPEAAEGDLLRLQYINNADLELKDVNLASDFSRELYQYVIKSGGLEK